LRTDPLHRVASAYDNVAVRPSADDRRYWFGEKRYGWGWGLPTAWQGWVVVGVYLSVVLVASVAIPSLVGFLAIDLVATAVFITVLRRKGPTPRWHWGKRTG
jgi:hypothetical protein